MSPDGHALGALCVIDGKSRHDFSPEDRERLSELAKMAADRLELRRVEMSAEQARRPLEEFANSSTAFVRFDERRDVVAWNDAAADLHRFEPDEGFARSFDTLVPERERALYCAS
jgi:GAF domain-containing protein